MLYLYFWMSQLCFKVNIKAFRWLESAVIHGSVYFPFSSGGGRLRRGGLLNISLLLLGVRKGITKFLGFFSKIFYPMEKPQL